MTPVRFDFIFVIFVSEYELSVIWRFEKIMDEKERAPFYKPLQFVPPNLP